MRRIPTPSFGSQLTVQRGCAGGSFLMGEKEVCLFVAWRNNEKLGARFSELGTLPWNLEL
jgi:hypothetical protein